ncbi:MAG TPA: hypothetical protein VGH28_09445 [Polyangiaceae bacterium]|jgi:hypothetical protein
MKAFVLAAISIAAACGPSAQQACDDFGVVYCSRNLACLTGADLQTFETAYGSNQDQCVANYDALNCKATQTPCGAGLNFDTGLYEQCVSDYKNSSCTDVSQPGFQPTSCSTSVFCH